MYRCNSFVVDLRHKFTVRIMNEIPVFVQSSELSNRTCQLRESTMKEFDLYIQVFCTVYMYRAFAINIFQNYTTSGYINATAQNARARRAVQPAGFSIQNLFLHAFVHLLIENHTKKILVLSFKILRLILKLRNQCLERFVSSLSQTLVY